MNHIFDVEHARLYGLPEAVMISNFQFWIAKNRANKENQREGRTWTYNTIKAFTDLFPYLSTGQIRRTLDRLVELKVLVTGTFNERAVDRTKWYAFFDECTFLPQQKHLSNSANACADSDKSLYRTDVNTDVNTVNSPPARPAAPLPAVTPTKASVAKFDVVATLAAAGVAPQHIDDWLTIRKAKRMPLTQTAWESTVEEAGKVRMSPADAVRHCCVRGWAGFEARYMGGDTALTASRPSPTGRPAAFEQSMSAANRAREKLFGPQQ